jgi:hypothetical protein
MLLGVAQSRVADIEANPGSSVIVGLSIAKQAFEKFSTNQTIIKQSWLINVTA